MRHTIGLLPLLAFAAAAHAAPCFPEKRTARPDHRLWLLHGWFDDDMKRGGPKGTWGTCTVNKGVVRERDGTRVAEIYCGLDILVPGLVDDHGIGVGAIGEQVLEAYGDGPSSTIVCAHTFEPKVRRARCWIPDDPSFARGRRWSYVVAGRLPETDAERGWLVRGEAALAFFRTRTILEIEHRGACH